MKLTRAPKNATSSLLAIEEALHLRGLAFGRFFACGGRVGPISHADQFKGSLLFVRRRRRSV